MMCKDVGLGILPILHGIFTCLLKTVNKTLKANAKFVQACKNCTTVVDCRLASDFLKNLEHLGHHILMLLL